MKEYEKQRNQLIILDNVLVRQAKHQLSLAEQKTIYYIVSMIKPTDTDLSYQFKINDYIKACGFEKSGQTYQDIRKNLSMLSDKSWFMEDEKTTEWTQMRWINKLSGNVRGGVVTIRIDEDLKPYLIELGNKFTQCELINILPLSSGYAIQLYLMLKSYEWMHQWIVACEDFREHFQLTQKTYTNWGELKRRVIDIAIKQINEKTDLSVLYKDNGSRGKKATQLAFVIYPKNVQEVNEIKAKVNNELNGKIPLNEADDSLLDWLSENKQASKHTLPKEHKKTKVQAEYETLLLEYQKQLEYETVIQKNPLVKNEIDEMINVMIDLELAKTKEIKVNGALYDKGYVMAIYKQLRSEHIEYVLWCLKETSTNIKNIKAYLQTTLFNAPSSINNWYSQRVRHDLHGEQL